MNASVAPAGSLGTRVIRHKSLYRWDFNRIWLETGLYFRILRNALIRPFNRAVAPEARLFAKVFRSDGSIESLGLVGTKLVTTVGVNFIVDAFQNTTEVETFNYHDSGTGTTAEAVGDTALVTKVETGRQTGAQGEGASANIYQTVATISYTATRAITEHGVFSATAAGTLLDRTVFTAINVDNGDSIQFTYELTLPAGS
jgi:hypothetical protein